MRVSPVVIVCVLLLATTEVAAQNPSCKNDNGEPKYKSRDPVDGNTYETKVNLDFEGHMVQCQLCDVVVNNFMTEVDQMARRCLSVLEKEGESSSDATLFTGPRGRKCHILPKYDKGETAHDVPLVVANLVETMCDAKVLDWMPIITEEYVKEDEKDKLSDDTEERVEQQREKEQEMQDVEPEEAWPDDYPPPPEAHKKVIREQCAADYLGTPAERKRFLIQTLKNIPATVTERNQQDIDAKNANVEPLAKHIVAAQNVLCKNMCDGEARPSPPQKIMGWSFSGKRMK